MALASGAMRQLGVRPSAGGLRPRPHRGVVLVPRTAAPTLSTPVLAEAEDLRARFTALQEEVSSYRALNAENQRLEDELKRLSQVNGELTEKVSGLQGEITTKLSVAKKDAAAQLTAVRQETTGMIDAAERNLEELRQQLHIAEKEKEQILFVMANAASRLGELLYPKGSLPSGMMIATRLEGLQGPIMPPALPVPSKPTFLASFLSFLKSAFYYVAGALVLYYTASIVRGAPPALNFEFALGCLAVCWLLPTLSSTLAGPRPSAA